MAEWLFGRPAAAAARQKSQDNARIPDDLALVAHRTDSTVVRTGGVVVKVHPVDTDPAWLRVRVRLAAHPRLRRVLLAPLRSPGAEGLVRPLPDGRLMTRWPCGVPVSPDAPEAAPWADAGSLLARLHAVPVLELPDPLPPMGGPRRAALALERMRREVARSGSPELAVGADVVERAWARLPGWARSETTPPQSDVLCHGDLHLGQLVRHPVPDGPWHLIDVDELGVGPAAWDLARPAAWYATGLLPPGDWHTFLEAYRAAGGCAVPPVGHDPWPELNVPAQALTVQTAALAVAKASTDRRSLDEVEHAVLEACDRIAGLSAHQGLRLSRGVAGESVVQEREE